MKELKWRISGILKDLVSLTPNGGRGGELARQTGREDAAPARADGKSALSGSGLGCVHVERFDTVSPAGLGLVE